MSEGAGAEATSSETSGSVAAAATAAATATPAAASAADPLAAEAMDELLAANDHESSKKRKYPEPGFAVERSGPAGGRGSYTTAFKLKAAAFTRRGPGAVALTLRFTSLRSHPVPSLRWGCENAIKYFFLASFSAPWCHLSDGCHLTHDYGSVQCYVASTLPRQLEPMTDPKNNSSNHILQ